jgi:hypothetical protein
MRVSEQLIFQKCFDDYAASHRLHPRQWRAAQSIRDCGTLARGANVLSCPNGDFEALQFHACRHRSCPRCAQAARDQWVDAEFKRLLPCPHFHVIFTLPHSLLPLWEYNRERFIPLFMRCVRESLLEMLANPTHLGATPGLLMSLHTWGRTLSHHPHVHCLLSAGGIDPDGQWRACRSNWLLPIKALQTVFRTKVISAVMDGVEHLWQLPPWSSTSHWLGTLRRLHRKHWNIEICPPYKHGNGVVLYLARYAKGGPLPYDRPLFLHKGTVSFNYTDHRDGRTKLLRLSTHDFISRMLWHAPPRGLHTTRHAGLYSSAQHAHHLKAQQFLQAQHAAQATPSAPTSSTLTTWPASPPPSASTAQPHAALSCPNCGLSLLFVRRINSRSSGTANTHRKGEFSPSAHTPPPTPHQRGPTSRSTGRQTACNAGPAAGT